MPEQMSVGSVPGAGLAQGLFLPAAAGVGRLNTVFVNLYAVNLVDGGWVLLDTGLPNFAWYVRQAVTSRYGADARPKAIVLTHGHFDHAGNALELVKAWDVPVLCHPLELPYLTGHSDYPPKDPTPGGAISMMARAFPTHGIDLGDRIHAVPADGTIAEMPGWQWIHTPGHTAGHMSLFREEDRLILAGDAVATTDLDAWSSQLTWPRKLSRPPAPLTPDWDAARRSIHVLAGLDPNAVAAGHGLPISTPHLADDLRELADSRLAPPKSRYDGHPAKYAADGSVSEVPPPVPDTMPQKLAIGVAGAVALGVLASLVNRESAHHGS